MTSPSTSGRYEAFGRALDKCGSYLERRFLVALLFSEKFSFGPPIDVGIAEDDKGIILGMQLPVAEWFIDFGMKHRDADVKVAIELDGHRFHDASREQTAKDRARDRTLVQLGWRVLRFTAKELIEDPIGCAQEAYDITTRLTRQPLPPLAKGRALQLSLKTGT